MHIKLPKNKPKPKKELKSAKNTVDFEEKTTKRKERKRPAQEINGNSILNDNL